MLVVVVSILLQLSSEGNGNYDGVDSLHQFKKSDSFVTTTTTTITTTTTTAATGVANLLLSTTTANNSSLSSPLSSSHSMLSSSMTSSSSSWRRRRRRSGGGRRRHLQQQDNNNNNGESSSPCTDEYDDVFVYCGLPDCNETLLSEALLSEEIKGTAICLDFGQKRDIKVNRSSASSCIDNDDDAVSVEKSQDLSTSHVCHCLGPWQGLKCRPMELELECSTSAGASSTVVGATGATATATATADNVDPNVVSYGGIVSQGEYTCECGGSGSSDSINSPVHCDNVQCTSSYEEIASPNYCIDNELIDDDFHCDCYTRICNFCPFDTDGIDENAKNCISFGQYGRYVDDRGIVYKCKCGLWMSSCWIPECKIKNAYKDMKVHHYLLGLTLIGISWIFNYEVICRVNQNCYNLITNNSKKSTYHQKEKEEGEEEDDKEGDGDDDDDESNKSKNHHHDSGIGGVEYPLTKLNRFELIIKCLIDISTVNIMILSMCIYSFDLGTNEYGDKMQCNTDTFSNQLLYASILYLTNLLLNANALYWGSVRGIGINSTNIECAQFEGLERIHGYTLLLPCWAYILVGLSWIYNVPNFELEKKHILSIQISMVLALVTFLYMILAEMYYSRKHIPKWKCDMYCHCSWIRNQWYRNKTSRPKYGPKWGGGLSTASEIGVILLGISESISVFVFEEFALGVLFIILLALEILLYLSQWKWGVEGEEEHEEEIGGENEEQEVNGFNNHQEEVPNNTVAM